MTPLAEDVLVLRRPLWRALSDLYLDTATHDRYPRVAGVLAASPYPLATLRAILFGDVHPAVRANLFAAAGVWSGFDPQWLEARILRRLARPRWRRGPACVFCGVPRAHWARLRPLIVAARAGAA